ncbi:MAG: hypothetical protein VKJ64_02530 [Leptolyngbyaceae bacterium]|nr:hypothetical protein [Leptolyngbyaceae bacterium]
MSWDVGTAKPWEPTPQGQMDEESGVFGEIQKQFRQAILYWQEREADGGREYRSYAPESHKPTAA